MLRKMHPRRHIGGAGQLAQVVLGVAAEFQFITDAPALRRLHNLQNTPPRTGVPPESVCMGAQLAAPLARLPGEPRLRLHREGVAPEPLRLRRGGCHRRPRGEQAVKGSKIHRHVLTLHAQMALHLLRRQVSDSDHLHAVLLYKRGRRAIFHSAHRVGVWLIVQGRHQGADHEANPQQDGQHDAGRPHRRPPQAAVYLLLNMPYLSGGGLRLRRPQRVLHLLGQVVGNGLALLQLGLHHGPLLLAGLPGPVFVQQFPKCHICPSNLLFSFFRARHSRVRAAPGVSPMASPASFRESPP